MKSTQKRELTTPSQIVDKLTNDENYTVNIMELPNNDPLQTGMRPPDMTSIDAIMNTKSVNLFYNPLIGNKITDISGQTTYESPLTILAHELGHSEKFLFSRVADLTLKSTPDGVFGDSEEKLIVETVKTDAAKWNCEGVRNNHVFKPYKTISPDSTQQDYLEDMDEGKTRLFINKTK